MSEHDQANNDAAKTGSGDDYRGSLGDLYWVVSSASIAFVLLLLAALFWPNLTERTKFFTTNLFNLMVAFAVIAQVIIYRQQWHVMQEGLKETRISREIENAAFVGVKDHLIESPPLHIGSNKIDIGLVNSGRTPAFNVTTIQDQSISPIGPVQFIPTLPVSVAMVPGTILSPTVSTGVAFFVSLTEEQVTAITERKLFLYVWGIVNYADIFGHKHWTRFCMVYHQGARRLNSANHGNESDYQHQSSHQDPN
jgi:hypothetical protein